jgi:hypothetical protein
MTSMFRASSTAQRIAFACATAISAVLMLSCSGGGDKAGPADAAPEAGAATYSAMWNDFLQGSCAQSFCHIGSLNTSGLHMDDPATAYMELVNQPASGPYCQGTGTRVVPGQPAMSILYQKIERPSPSMLCGAAMPGMGKPPLLDSDIARVKEWILLGAKNN